MEPIRVLTGKAAHYARLHAKAEVVEAKLRAKLGVIATKYNTLMPCENNFSQSDAYHRHILLEDYDKAIMLMSRHNGVRKARDREWPTEPEAKAREMYSFICEYRQKLSLKWTKEFDLKGQLFTAPVTSPVHTLDTIPDRPGILQWGDHIRPGTPGTLSPEITGHEFLMRGSITQVLLNLLTHQAMKHDECTKFDQAQLTEWKRDIDAIKDKASVIEQCLSAIREWERPRNAYAQAMRDERYSDALEIRRQISHMRLLGIFNYINLDDATDIEKWARNAERGIYNRAIEQAKAIGVPRNWESKHFRRLQERTHMKVVSSLVLGPNRSSVISRLETCVIKPQDLAFMTPAELDPEAAEAQRKFQEWKSRASKVNLDDYSDGMYACPRCKCRKTDYTERQTRSADEPMTVFLFCLGCNKRWRM
uniref:TFIIS-type domain-containing protein n=1 Tax=viral metagenome TaxID=1070528 RepID=A0A6C0K8R9_9ZZZZ